MAEHKEDYYIPRSRQVAEAVLWKIPSRELKRFLLIFHQEISPMRIGRYDVFRRAAFDAKLIGRAFPKWEEGLKFYEEASHRDTSYSLKQQGALYLSQKRNFELAFNWIDDARSMARKNSFAIRNSYAVILFDANYQKISSDEVRQTLDESMGILKSCYNQDHRKVYHAKIFAEQALKYTTKYPESANTRDYLESSKEWLNKELEKRVGDRRMLQLRSQVLRALKGIGR